MAKLIGTSGHVDHGKTTLIRALTGIDADRLPEEKSRGMTIDLGFAYVDLPDIGRVSIVDVPGHERFLSNMLVGATGIDVALLCIAADAGIMPQTREHFAILELLPVDQMVVALTRADLSDPEFLDLVSADVQAMLADTRFAGSPILPVSAVSGDGIEALKEALSAAIRAESEPKTGPWYLPIDRVFTVKGHGTVVTGTLVQGVIADGDAAVLMPGDRATRVRSIQSHELSLKNQEFGSRTALNLAGLEVSQVSRGMAVGAAGALFPTECLDANVRWVTPEGTVKHGSRVRVSIGTDEVMGKVFLSESQLEIVQLRLERPAAVALNQPLILRRYSPPDLLGGGRVVVPQATPRRKSETADVASGTTDADRILSALLGKESGMHTDDLCRLLGRTPQQLGPVFEQMLDERLVLGFGGLWLTPDDFDRGVALLHNALDRLHVEAPTKAGIGRDRAITAAGLRWGGKALDRIISALVSTELLKSAGNEIAHPAFFVQLNARQEELIQRLEEQLTLAGYTVPTPRELTQKLGVPPQAVDQILEVGVQAGRVVRIAPDIFYLPAQIEAMKAVVKDFGRPFTAAEFRDAVETSRKYTIPLLELWDAQRFTVRQGDTRVVIG